MSYESWHVYGYGICVTEIEKTSPTVEKLQSLLGMAPNFKSRISEWLTECGIHAPEYEDYMEFDQDYLLRLAYFLKEVILEAEGIEFTACEDYDGRTFLVYEPSYPWSMNAKESLLKKEDIDNLLQKYVSVLIDQPFEIDYQSVENGG